jgi:2-iminobutanoate/2-iminopropanoate deaminase
VTLGLNYCNKGGKIMELKKVATETAPAAIGPYSQAIICGEMVFTSGQIPINPASGNIEATTIEEQAEQVMKNLGEVLKAAGSSFEKAVKTTCFLADMADFAAFNGVYAKYFTTKPARSCVAVKTLPKNVLVEVEVIATI